MKSNWSIAIFLIVELIVGSAALARHKSAEQYVQSGDDFAGNGRYKDAIAQYTKAIHSDKNNPKYYQLRAQSEFQIKKYKQAQSDLSHAIALNPNDSDAYSARALVLEELGQYKKEKTDLDCLCALNPNIGTNLLWRARIEKRLGENRKVIEDLNRAIYLGLTRDELAELYKLRSEAYKKLGKKGESEQELAKYQSIAR